MTVRIAMWSGPRNISTAMMRAFENRSDCAVIDEPFYACYLAASGADHPMRDEVLQSQSTDWNIVATQLTQGAVELPLFYQKHMTHHMLVGIELTWVDTLRHAFLIRDPLEVVSSYRQKRGSVSTDDIGIQRQLELYREISERSGQHIPVIEGRDVLIDPEGTLKRLCIRLGIEFDAAMLRWPAGTRASDGVWAPHWYQAVEDSTEFARWTPKEISLSDADRRVADASRDAYEALRRHRI